MKHKLYISQAIGIIISLIGIIFGVKFLFSSIDKYNTNILQILLSGIIIILSLNIFFISIYSSINREQKEETNELLEEILIKLEEKDQPNNKDIDISINNTKE